MTPDVSFPLLVIPADTAADLVRTIECEHPCHLVPSLDRYCRRGCTAGRVPDPAAPRRLTFPERPVVPCRACDGQGDYSGWNGLRRCQACTGEGVVPLVGGMTVSLAVERWRCEWPDDRVHWYDNRPRAFWTFGCKSLARRQVVVAVAQVADVIEEVRVRLPGEPWFPWRRAAPGGRQDYEHLDVERRWVVVLGRVDPCEEER